MSLQSLIVRGVYIFLSRTLCARIQQSKERAKGEGLVAQPAIFQSLDPNGAGLFANQSFDRAHPALMVSMPNTARLSQLRTVKAIAVQVENDSL